MNVSGKIPNVNNSFFNTDPRALEIAACEQFADQYPGIRYDRDNDTYVYRGYRFDYFVAGVQHYSKIGNIKPMFMLVDFLNYNNWLFTYGESEDRWKDFLNRTTQICQK